MKVKVGINGFGRIGRNAFKIAVDNAKGYEIVAINDPADPATLAHLLKYDSCFGKFDADVKVETDGIIVNGKKIKVTSFLDPEDIPWGEFGVEIVLEASGKFKSKNDLSKHIKAGARKVLISAPANDEDITIVLGVNEQEYDPLSHHIISNASCTTNCLAPFAKIIDREFGIESGLMTTIHAYTNDQKILDLPHKDLRRARAAGLSMIPTTTGAAKAVALVLPQLKGKLNGMAIRVPTPTVSVVDIVFSLNKETTKDEVNKVLKAAAEGEMKGVLGFSEEPLVSIDYKMDPRSSVIDGLSTMILDGRLLKIVAWYDNEWGYSCRIADIIEYIVSMGL